MNAALAWLEEGGPVMPALVVVGVLLYGSLFDRALALLGGQSRPPEANLVLARALIAGAPLLGLLGTVGGLISSFSALVEEASLEQVGVGIGHALRTTQYGIALAAPALLFERLLSGRWARGRAARFSPAGDAASAPRGEPWGPP